MNIREILPSYIGFMQSFAPLLKIEGEEDYQEALDAVDQLFELGADDDDDRYGVVIDTLSKSISRYESKDVGMADFIQESNAMPADIAMLITLMDQNNLTGSDFPEIGGKSMVSQVLKGHKQLSRKAIDGLSDRFGISAGAFFD